MVAMGRRPGLSRRDEGAEQDVLPGRERLSPGELAVPDRDELTLQAGEAVLQDEVALALCTLDRVHVRLVEDVLGGLAPRVGAVLVEAPDVRLLPGGRARVAPRPQVAV